LADTIEQMVMSSRITLISDALDIPLALVAMMVVSHLDARQAAKHRGLGGAIG
jgi:hypothetical protein